MKQRIIESVVAFIFGAVIAITSLITEADIVITILGAVLAVVGIACFIWALVDKKTRSDSYAAFKNAYDIRVAELEAALGVETAKSQAFEAEFAKYKASADELAEKLGKANAELLKAKTKLAKLNKQAIATPVEEAPKKKSTKKVSE